MRTHRFEVRLEASCGAVWVTVFSVNMYTDEEDEMLSSSLDRFLEVPNALYDVVALAHDGDVNGIKELYRRVA